MFNKYLALILLLGAGGAAKGQGRNIGFLEVASHGKYKAGAYTLADGSRHPASLRIWQDLTHNVVQVDQGKAEPVNLQANELRSFVMGRDSFVVMRGVTMAGQPAELPFGEVAFFKVKLAGRANTISVLEHDQLVKGGVQAGPFPGGTMPSGLGHALTWILCPAAAASPVAIPWAQNDFAQHVAALFIENTVLCQRIRAGLEGPTDFKRIVYAYLFKKDIEQVTYEEATAIFR